MADPPLLPCDPIRSNLTVAPSETPIESTASLTTEPADDLFSSGRIAPAPAEPEVSTKPAPPAKRKLEEGPAVFPALDSRVGIVPRKSMKTGRQVGTKSMRRGGVPDDLSDLIPVNTILRLNDQILSPFLADALLYPLPAFFRCVRVLGQSRMLVMLVKRVTRTRPGRNNYELRDVDEPAVAMKIQAYQAGKGADDLLLEEFIFSNDIFCAIDESSRTPYFPIHCIGPLDYATEADATHRVGGVFGWQEGMLNCAIMEAGIPLEQILGRSISPDHRNELFQSAYEAVSILHKADWVHRDVKVENFVVKVELDEDGNERETKQVFLIDCPTAVVVGTEYQSGGTGKKLEVVGTHSYLSMGAVCRHIAYMVDEAVADKKLASWSAHDVLVIQAFLRGASPEAVLKDADYWSLGMSLLHALDPDYVDTHAIHPKDLDDIGNALFRSEPPPTELVLERMIGNLASRFTPFHDPIPGFLLRLDQYGNRMRGSTGNVEEGKLGELICSLLGREKLMGIASGQAYTEIQADRVERAFRALGPIAAPDTSNPIEIARPSTHEELSRDLTTVEPEPEGGEDAPKKGPIITKSMAKKTRVSEVIEVHGVLDGTTQIFRYPVDDLAAGTRRNYVLFCGLAGCTRATGDEPSRSKSRPAMQKHLARATEAKQRCSYLNQSELEGDDLSMQVIDAEGFVVGE